MSKKLLTAFCFTDVHCQQAMLDYPTTVRRTLITACENAVSEFGLADVAIMGGDNVSDYPHWNKSCALPKKNFIDLKNKLNACVSKTARGGKVLYAAGNNDFILGDIPTSENEPYNTTDFYDFMDNSLGVLENSECLKAYSEKKPNERYLNAFHYVINCVDFIIINIDPNTAFNTHEGYYTNETLLWVKNKLNEIDPSGVKPVFIAGHLSACYYYYGTDLEETFINGDKQLFYDIFKGHKNAFYLYGHIHGERSLYKDYSSGCALHIKNGAPLGANLQKQRSPEQPYDYTFVHMGGLRPFGKQYFHDDGLTGYGGEAQKAYHPGTATPKLAQYLVLEVYSDRAVFYIRNAADGIEGYTQADKPLCYTVYYQK